MKRTSSLAALALVSFGATAPFLLSACGSAPAVAPPQLPVALPERFEPAASSATGAGTEAVEASAPWWGSFDDPRLRSLVDEALGHNLDLAAASARLEAAAAEARIAGADVFPALNATGNATRQQQVLTFIRDPQSGSPLTSRNTNYGVGLNVSWELDLWGRLRNQRSAAAADLQAATADFAGARLSIAAQTMKAWFAAVEARHQMDLAATTATSFARTAERIRSRYETGVRSSLDVRLALVDQANAEAALQARRTVHDGALRQLELVLGRYPGAEIDANAELTAPSASVPPGLPADLLARRPDLVAAERRLAATDRRTATSRRALLPRLTLTASGGRSSDQLGDLLDGDFSVWSIAGGLLQPLFRGGRLRAQVDRSEALADAAVADWANRVLFACGEVERLLTAEVHLRAQERAQVTAAEQARAAHELAQSRYESGLDDVITLLAAQRASAQAESQLLQVRRALLETRIDLHLALGGDFDTGHRESGHPDDEGDAS